MSVSIVIPNYNGERYLQKCLDSIMIQSMQPDEIIIVDNDSHDNSMDIIRRYGDKIKTIIMDKNYGFSVAVNRGIKESKCDYVALLNNDTELQPQWLEKLVECISSDDKIFACCSKMLRYDNRNIIDDAGDFYTALGWEQKIGDGAHDDTDYLTSREVFSACAGAAIYRKSVFDTIGYFDENFFAYMEDVDISYRAKVYGYKNYYCAEAKVYHIGSATSGSKYNDFKVKLASRNNIYLIHKNMTLWQIIINFIFILLGIIVKAIFFSIKGYGKTYISGVIEGLKNKKNINKIRLNNNGYVYRKIEIELLKGMFKLVKERIAK
ncbi:glycosyltransferase family 2 protein [Clostridium sp. MSJ-8]|uniref:glycosyltransferase family 2 protein n=1 Tax=Clostridium sp. MSJ-8 TaxID=2841510 RepID=UPI00209ED9D4|nr:glycosyltransferase family 2 protein [Clostridium sp. MSJ-8]